MGKFEQGWIIPHRSPGLGAARQLACFVGGTLKLKDLKWLPTLDTFRTFAVQMAL
jgi:hypothetical protein